MFGFPGLESTLPLMLQAEREGKLSAKGSRGKARDGSAREILRIDGRARYVRLKLYRKNS